MKKTVTLIVTIFAMLLCGCGNYNLIIDNLATTESHKQTKNETNTQTQATTKSVKPIVEATYTIVEDKNIDSSFSNGYAWVKCRNNEGTAYYYGLIDKNGYLVYSVETSAYLLGTKTTKFNNGFTCIYTYTESVGYTTIVIDENGKEVFNGEKYKDKAQYKLLAQGENIALLIEHTIDFSDSKYYLCEIDKTGNIISRTETDRGKEIDNAVYCGENIFNIEKRYIYNANTHTCIYPSKENLSYEIIGEFYEKKVLIFAGRSLADCNIGITANELSSEETFLSAIESKKTPRVSWYYEGEGLYESYAKGSGRYFDADGNLVIKAPDDWDIIESSGFSGGYATFFLRGSDTFTYVAAIDRKGNIMYEPIKCGMITRNKNYYYSWHGYIQAIIDNKEVIIDPNGKIIESGLPKDITIGHSGKIGTIEFADGFVREEKNGTTSKDYGTKYISFKSYRSDVGDITKITKLSNYNEIKSNLGKN